MIRYPASSKQISSSTLSLGTVLACLIKISEIIRLKLFPDLVLSLPPPEKLFLLSPYLSLYLREADEVPYVWN